MTLSDLIFGETKAEEVFSVLKIQGRGGSFTRTEATPENYKAFLTAGYQKNPFVFRAVNLIARAASRVDFFVSDSDGERMEGHMVSEILSDPNPELGRSSLIERWLSDLILTGNAYSYFAQPQELFPLRPDAVRVLHSQDPAELVGGYSWGHGLKNEEQEFEREEVMHIKTYHPTSEFYGMSPIHAAEAAIALSNRGFEWNVNLLDKGGIPPWFLKMDGVLTQEQKTNINDELEEKYQGFENQGKPMVLEGEMDAETIGQGPKELDHIAGQKWAGRTIATALGMDPAMLGFSESQTFANFETAWESLYQDTVYPYLELITNEIETFFKQHEDGEWTIRFDEDQRKALTGDSDEDLAEKTWWTVNEKREADGKEEIDGGDVILVSQTNVPLAVQAGADIDLPENGETASLEIYAD